VGKMEERGGIPGGARGGVGREEARGGGRRRPLRLGGATRGH
jgi:hypothetical protein